MVRFSSLLGEDGASAEQEDGGEEGGDDGQDGRQKTERSGDATKSKNTSL